MKEEFYTNYLMRLAIIQKEVSELSVECLKRNYQNIENLMIKLKKLHEEEENIINRFDLVQLALYYNDYKETLSKKEIEALSNALLYLQAKKNTDIVEKRGR